MYKSSHLSLLPLVFRRASIAILVTANTLSFAQADDDLAKKAQNPIASMVSVPIDTSIDFGAPNGTAVISLFQPVIPVTVGDWNLISRPILPIAWVEGAVGGGATNPTAGDVASKEAYGLGDLNYTLFASPNAAKSIIWGLGPSITLPTATDPILGTEKWSAGPSVVLLAQPAPWSFGVLGRQLWSIGGASDRTDVNQFMLQYFVNYNLSDGWYLLTDPANTVNWKAPGEKWTVPIGGGIGRIFKIGNQPLNVRLRAYYNVVRPDSAAEWSAHFSIAWLFPK